MCYVWDATPDRARERLVFTDAVEHELDE